MDGELVAAVAVVGPIVLACCCLVWWVYAEFPSRDEHLFAGSAERRGVPPGQVRARAALWLRLVVTLVFVTCAAAGFAVGTLAFSLGLGGAATILVWVAKPRTPYGRRVAAAEARRDEKW